VLLSVGRAEFEPQQDSQGPVNGALAALIRMGATHARHFCGHSLRVLAESKAGRRDVRQLSRSHQPSAAVKWVKWFTRPGEFAQPSRAAGRGRHWRYCALAVT